MARLEARLGASAAMRERMKAQAADLHKAVALTREAALDMDAFPIRTVEDVALVLGGPSVSTKGDATVAVATTACLSENGFRPQGVKRALMHSTDLPRGLILPDDLLFARSNTAELVGRVSRYGSSEPLYASDLTYRVRTVAPDVRPSYLEIVLRGAFLAGRWQNAGGASGSMKKVSMGYLRAFAFPTPPLEEQDRILARLDAVEREADAARAAIAATLAELDLFDAATLREVFA